MITFLYCAGQNAPEQVRKRPQSQPLKAFPEDLPRILTLEFPHGEPLSNP